MPQRQRAAGKEGFGGPFAEVDRKGDSVAIVTGQDDHVLAAWMAAEDGAHSLGEENRAAPAVRDAHGMQSRMQIADTRFKPAEARGGFALTDIETVQIGRCVFVCLDFRGLTEKRSERRWHRDETGA